MLSYQDILQFWFDELEPSDWFKKDEKLDGVIRERFLFTYRQSIAGELFSWRENARGRLAEIIVLDQFSRNMFRGSGESFRYDSLALCLSQEFVRHGFGKDLEVRERSFAYMPYMHSESRIVHQEAVKVFSEPGLEGNLEYEHKHKRIIDRFDRYPHRNDVLGRKSTPEEIEFLKGPDSSF